MEPAVRFCHDWELAMVFITKLFKLIKDVDFVNMFKYT